MPADSRYGQKWTTEETIIAYYYYCMIPFGKVHQYNPEIIKLANTLGRTPSSVVKKMSNLAHFDPAKRSRGVEGLSHASKTDQEVVDSFCNNWEELVKEARMLEAELQGSLLIVHDINRLPEGNVQRRLANHRQNQRFFRNSVLASYNNTCCITGINIPELLIASHIKPWKVSNPHTERTNPSNGLCLNAFHDKAFDRGLITVLPDYSIRVSSTVQSNDRLKDIGWLQKYDGEKIVLPNRFYPQKEFLEYHNDVIFIP